MVRMVLECDTPHHSVTSHKMHAQESFTCSFHNSYTIQILARARDDLVSVDFRRDCAFRSGLEFSSCLHIFAFYYVVSKCIGSIYVYHQISGTHHQCIKVTNERKSKRNVCSAHETKETSFSVCRYGHQRLFFRFALVLFCWFYSLAAISHFRKQSACDWYLFCCLLG